MDKDSMERIAKAMKGVSKKWAKDKAAIERYEQWDRAVRIAEHFKLEAMAINSENPGSVTLNQIIKRFKVKRGKRVKPMWESVPYEFSKTSTKGGDKW